MPPPSIAKNGSDLEERESTINIYGVGAKNNENQDSHAGGGIMFDSEVFKFKAEGTSDFFKSGAVFKLNPVADKWYIKAGASYLNQKMYAPDDTNERVNQYSGTLATGYMTLNNLYLEIGGSYTDLEGENIGTDYEVVDETTELAYFEIAKRWDTPIGTIDTTVNAGEVFYEYVSDEFSYGAGVDYYPVSNAKIGYRYQNEENNITGIYSAQYGFAFAEYSDNISQDTYQVSAGVKVAFSNLLDVSSYGIPSNIIPHLSELHMFESISLGSNLTIQSSSGVQMTQEAINRNMAPNSPPNTAPVISGITSTGDLNIGTELTDIGLTISDDDLSLVTWTLSYTKAGDTGSFSQTTGTGNTLSGITLTANNGWGGGWIIYATVVDSGSGSTQTVIVYSN